MENTHTINYEGLDLYCYGYHTEAEEECNVLESFNLEKVLITQKDGTEVDIFSWLNSGAIEQIGLIVLEENY